MGDELSVELPWRDPHVRFFTKQSLRRLVAGPASTRSMSADSGAFARDVPGLRRLAREEPGSLYEAAERALLSLFAYRLHAVAAKARG